jgi:hypothetical protein
MIGVDEMEFNGPINSPRPLEPPVTVAERVSARAPDPASAVVAAVALAERVALAALASPRASDPAGPAAPGIDVENALESASEERQVLSDQLSALSEQVSALSEQVSAVADLMGGLATLARSLTAAPTE